MLQCKAVLTDGRGKVFVDAVEDDPPGIDEVLVQIRAAGLWAEGMGYLRHRTTDYEAWIVEDVFGCVKECAPQVGVRSRSFIGGLSMCGYVAPRLGAKYARIFSGVSAHSAVSTLDTQRSVITRALPFQPDGRDNGSALFWMLQPRDLLDPIRFDCGTEDTFLDQNRRLSHDLAVAGIAHSYEEYPGGHDWGYWTEGSPATLRFFAKILNAEEPSGGRQASES